MLKNLQPHKLAKRNKQFPFVFAIGKTNLVTSMQFWCPLLRGNAERWGRRKGGKITEGSNKYFSVTNLKSLSCLAYKKIEKLLD